MKGSPVYRSSGPGSSDVRPTMLLPFTTENRKSLKKQTVHGHLPNDKLLDALTSVKRGKSRCGEGIRTHTEYIVSLKEVVFPRLLLQYLWEVLREKGFEFCFLKFLPWPALPIMPGPVVGQSIMVAVCGIAAINLIAVVKRNRKGLGRRCAPRDPSPVTCFL